MSLRGQGRGRCSTGFQVSSRAMEWRSHSPCPCPGGQPDTLPKTLPVICHCPLQPKRWGALFPWISEGHLPPYPTSSIIHRSDLFWLNIDLYWIATFHFNSSEYQWIDWTSFLYLVISKLRIKYCCTGCHRENIWKKILLLSKLFKIGMICFSEVHKRHDWVLFL